MMQLTGERQPSYLGEVIAQFKRAIALDPNFPAAYEGLSQALIVAGDVEQAVSAARRAVLWGNERYQKALEQTEECLRKAPSFGGAEIYRIIILVGLGRMDEARTRFAEFLVQPIGFGFLPPHSQELARRAMAALHSVGWRPTLAADREAV
jgi:tetratricopeptide (TPR) repeat protein